MDKAFIDQWKRYEEYRRSNHVAALEEWSKHREAEKAIPHIANGIGGLYPTTSVMSRSAPPRIEEPTFANFMSWLVIQEEDRG